MPGPKPKHQPQFTPEEIAQAKQKARQHTAPSAEVLRAKRVLILQEEPKIGNAAVAKRLGTHANTVWKWRKRWATEGFTLEDRPRSGRPPVFPPEEISEVKAIACQLPADRGLPLSRFSLEEIRREIHCQSKVSMSRSSIWRILKQDALRPWYHHSWLFPKDPLFLERAGPVLDLYQGTWEGEPLGPNDYVLSADEKSQLQILKREFLTQPPKSGRKIRWENEYSREGTVAYLAAIEVNTGEVFGRVDETTGITPFQGLLDLVMTQEPYASADRVFWIVDNGSSHHPSTFPARLQKAYSNAIAVRLPIHASWLNQIEIYFSILQRKALTPNDLGDRQQMEDRILGFQRRYNLTAKPFNGRFTRRDLKKRLRSIKAVA
jgi:transposase